MSEALKPTPNTILETTTTEHVFYQALNEQRASLNPEELKRLQIDFYTRLRAEKIKLLQSPYLSKTSRQATEDLITKCDAEIAALNSTSETSPVITTSETTSSAASKETTIAKRENKVVTNLPELKSSGIATELARFTVYGYSSDNQIKVKYPSLPSTHVVIAECDFFDIRTDVSSCADLSAMEYFYNQYASGSYRTIKWYSAPISQLT